MINDPVADLLTRIRNATLCGASETIVPYSNLKYHIVKILVNEGYVVNASIEDSANGVSKIIKLELSGEDTRLITHIKRVSKPGRRVYVSSSKIPRPLRGMGCVIISTSNGIVTGKEARKLGLGGEILCEIW